MNGWKTQSIHISQKPDLQPAWLLESARLPQNLSLRPVFGFTLAELLIALLILGQIATFTIPKIINTQQNSKHSAVTKETATAVVQALQLYRLKDGTQTDWITVNGMLVPYLNYVKTDSTSLVDGWDCSWSECYRMHNGAVLYSDWSSFGGTSSTNAIRFWVDPDGKLGGAGQVTFYIYYTGRLTSLGHILPNTSYRQHGGVIYTANPSPDPTWFSW